MVALIEKNKLKRRIVNTVIYVFMIVLALIFVFPYFYMLMKSLMTSEEVVGPIKLLPDKPQWHNYVEMLTTETAGTKLSYPRATLNSLIIIGFNMVAIPLSASLIAFSFAKLRWVGRNFMFAIMMGTIMLPGVVTQIPLYVMYTNIGWLNTFFPFTIPNLFGGGAMNIFLIRQFMMGIPKDLDEAARLDGASVMRRYFSICLPLCRAVLVYTAVTVFMGGWSDYYGPLIYMESSDAPYTLAYVVFKSAMEENVTAGKTNMRMAAGVFMTIVPLILFSVFQRELVEGIAITGVKG